MNRLVAALTFMALVGCSQGDKPAGKTASGMLARGQGTAAAPITPVFGLASAATSAGSAYEARIRQQQAFADLPDRGELLSYVGRGGNRSARVEGAYTWHRVEISEEHALRAIATGRLRLPTPSGQTLDIRYDHHVEHPSGDLSWVGHIDGEPGAQTIITFGAEAVYGSIGQPGKRSLRLTTRSGAAWIVETDPIKLAGVASANPREPDAIAVPKRRAGADMPAKAQSQPKVAAAAALASTTIDLLIGYTQGFANANPGVTTRLNQMVTVGNEALANSQVDAQIRLVHAMLVNYTDDSENKSTLEQLTGFDSSSQQYTTPNPAFNALRAARETHGADLVTLVRAFREPEQKGCGIAWLIGGGLEGIRPGDGQDYFGYSVVSDGYDEDDSKTYYCREEALIHELGHNMGSQHDRASAAGTDDENGDGNLLDPDEYGAFAYSFGLKTAASAGNFYTVMAYGDEGQQDYRVFSNPGTAFCGGRACGTSNDDNARGLGQTVSLVAGFRAAAGSATPPHLVAITRIGGSGRTEVHGLDVATNYSTFFSHDATVLHETASSNTWTFQLGDYNRDGTLDLYAIQRLGATGKTEVHVLNGATRYTTFLANIATGLHATGSSGNWVFRTGDYNLDGRIDIFALNRTGASGKTEVHVLDGASGFQRFSAHIATALHATGGFNDWAFEIGDLDRDGRADLYAIARQGASGATEVHVLGGAQGFQAFIMHAATALHPTGVDPSWHFKLGDYNRDGFLDVYAINKNGASGKTELHVLSGAGGYAAFVAHIATGLHPVDANWDLEIARMN